MALCLNQVDPMEGETSLQEDLTHLKKKQKKKKKKKKKQAAHTSSRNLGTSSDLNCRHFISLAACMPAGILHQRCHSNQRIPLQQKLALQPNCSTNMGWVGAWVGGWVGTILLSQRHKNPEEEGDKDDVHHDGPNLNCIGLVVTILNNLPLVPFKRETITG